MKENENEVSTTPQRLIELAITNGSDVDKLEKLMALQERWEAAQSKKQFFKALSEFQSKCPVVSKNRTAKFAGRGGEVSYKWSDLAHIIEQVREPLRGAGLSFRWEFSEGEKISVTCIITHESGHSERTVMEGVADTSGTKNSIQSQGSTLTYLQRYTLIGALGIGSAQDDVDGDKSQSEKTKVMSEELKNRISSALDKDALQQIWDENKSLHKEPFFIDPIKRKNIELSGNEKPTAAVSEDLKKQISIQDELIGLDIIWKENPSLHTNKVFAALIHAQKLKIAKPRKEKVKA